MVKNAGSKNKHGRLMKNMKSPNSGLIHVVRCLEVNNTLQLLKLPRCSQAIQENITSIQEVVNKKRESRGCQVKLEIQIA